MSELADGGVSLPAEENPNPPQRVPLLAVMWSWVLLPFAYGVYELIRKVAQLFN